MPDTKVLENSINNTKYCVLWSSNQCETLFYCWGSEVGKILSRSLLCSCSLLTQSHPSPFLAELSDTEGFPCPLCPHGLCATPTLGDTTELMASPCNQGAQQKPKGSDDPGGTEEICARNSPASFLEDFEPKVGVSSAQHTLAHTMVFKLPHRSSCCVLHSMPLKALMFYTL